MLGNSLTPEQQRQFNRIFSHPALCVRYGLSIEAIGPGVVSRSWRREQERGKISVYIEPCAVEHHASCDYTQLSFEQEPVMPAPFNIVGIDHVVLRAADPTKLERFYLDALGLTFADSTSQRIEI